MDLGLRRFKSQEGYTLLETVAAMSIFLGVLIPLVTLVAAITLDRSPDDVREALSLAQSEIGRLEGGVPRDSSVLATTRLSLHSVVTDTLGIRTVRVTIKSKRDSARVVLSLEKSLMWGATP